MGSKAYQGLWWGPWQGYCDWCERWCRYISLASIFIEPVLTILVSVLTHLYSRAPLFKQGISMSGTPLMLRPQTLDQAESSYKEVMTALGLENASVEERIQYLVNMTPEDLVAKIPLTIQLLPFIDGALIPHALTFESFRTDPDTNMFRIFGAERLDADAPEYGAHVRRRQQTDLKLPGESWCEDLMLGDCQSDVRPSIHLLIPKFIRHIGTKHPRVTSSS